MSTDPSLNEPIDTPRRHRVSWLAIAPWICLLWVGIAWCTFWGTIDNIDVDGTTKEAFQPYEPLITVVVKVGLAAMPIGIVCGVLALVFRKDSECLSLLPTLILTLLLASLAYHQYRMYQWWQQGDGLPAIAVPAVPD